MVREHTLIVTDLYLEPDARATLAEQTAFALPALETLLSRASGRESGDWRTWILDRFAAPPSIAASSYLSTGGSPALPGQAWIVSGVHLQAGHDHVHLAAIVDLQEHEWAELSAGFERSFGSEVGVLAGGESSQAHLMLTAPLVATSVDPARVVGHDVHDYLPGGPGGAALRRLTTELQMWLFDHPVNRAREARGLPTVTSFWIWGGEVRPSKSAGTPLPMLISSDPFLRGVWMFNGVKPEPYDLQRHQATLAQARPLSQDSLMTTLSLQSMPGTSWQERMTDLDEHWLKPALDGVRSGRFDLLRVYLNDLWITATRNDLRRFWRPRQPWLGAIA